MVSDTAVVEQRSLRKRPPGLGQHSEGEGCPPKDQLGLLRLFLQMYPLGPETKIGTKTGMGPRVLQMAWTMGAITKNRITITTMMIVAVLASGGPPLDLTTTQGVQSVAEINLLS